MTKKKMNNYWFLYQIAGYKVPLCYRICHQIRNFFRKENEL